MYRTLFDSPEDGERAGCKFFNLKNDQFREKSRAPADYCQECGNMRRKHLILCIQSPTQAVTSLTVSQHLPKYSFCFCFGGRGRTQSGL